MNSLDRLAKGYADECTRIRQDLSIAESQLRDYQARLGKPFLHEAYLSELTALRDQLKAGLSASHGTRAEGGPSVAEIAAQVRTLKAAHSIDASPQRIRQKHTAAEEPVTTRIRRRHESIAVSDQAIEKEASFEVYADMPATPKRDSTSQPPKSYHKRVTQSRRDDDDSSLPPL